MAPLTYSNEDDLTLFHHVKEGKEGAFKMLFLRYYDKLCRFVVLLHHDHSLAEEVAQEVFTRIWEKRQEIEIQTSVKYYLYNACRNQAYNLVSKKDRQHTLWSTALEDIIVDEQNPEQVFIFDTLHNDFQEAINTLPAKAKEVFMLKYFEKARHKEIARSMNISESMVEKHIANALRHLRKKLAMHTISAFFILLGKVSLLILLLS